MDASAEAARVVSDVGARDGTRRRGTLMSIEVADHCSVYEEIVS
jgi:hypothetical protein